MVGTGGEKPLGFKLNELIRTRLATVLRFFFRVWRGNRVFTPRVPQQRV